MTVSAPASSGAAPASPGEVASMFGASLLSAIGSLSLHIAPVVTLVMIADARTSVAGAGWVRSLALMGEFAAALALPLLCSLQLSRRTACLVAAMLLGGLALAAAREPTVFQLGWLVIGIASGTLKYLGVMAASQSSRLTWAFTLRLSFVLLLAGSVSAVLVFAGSLATYEQLLQGLGLLLVATLTIGIVLYRGPAAERTEANLRGKPRFAARPGLRQLSGLLVLYCFFAGISGVLIYSLHQAVDRGMTATDTIWALALTKVAAGAWLIVSAMRAKTTTHQNFLALAVLLAASTVAIYQSRLLAFLFAGLLFWEIAANNLSARLQAAVVARAPEFAGKWLNVTILLGGVTGPLLNGLAISSGAGAAYVAFAGAMAFLPIIWQHWMPLSSERTVTKEARA